MATQGDSSGTGVSIGALDPALGRRAPTGLASPPNKRMKLTIASHPEVNGMASGGGCVLALRRAPALAAYPRCSPDALRA